MKVEREKALGASSSLSEAEVHWRTFLEHLQSRGLRDLRLIISDDHAGMKKARMAVFPSVPWQRCQFHLCQNAQSYAPKKTMKPEIAREMKRAAIKKYEKTAPEFIKWLEENVEEGLPIYQFPKEHRKKLRTSNGIEKSKEELE